MVAKKGSQLSSKEHGCRENLKSRTIEEEVFIRRANHHR